MHCIMANYVNYHYNEYSYILCTLDVTDSHEPMANLFNTLFSAHLYIVMENWKLLKMNLQASLMIPV